MTISLEFTPNPNSLKFRVYDKALTDGCAFNYKKDEDARGSSPLAEALFQVQGVTGVMVGKDFVTVLKSAESDLTSVHDRSRETLIQFLASGEAPVIVSSKLVRSEFTALEQKIERFLAEVIEPKLAQDGGSLTFEGFVNGAAYIQLQGSCSTCPASKETLKNGIEGSLKKVFPEVNEVISV